MAKEQVLDLVRRIARSIEQNLEKLQEDDAKLKKLANGIQTFYVSLFDDKKGVFHNTDIDEDLTCDVVPDTPKSPAPKRKRPMTTERVGTGKGSPLKPRKVHVSKRQQRVRVKRGFDMSAFGGKDKSREPRRVASRTTEPSTSHAGDESSSDDASTSRTSSPPPAQREPPSAQREPELQPTLSPPASSSVRDDGPLSSQVRNDSRGRGGVQRFQLLAAMSQDGETSSIGSDYGDQASNDELGLFAREIEHWHRADVRIEYALRDMWYEICETITPDPSDSAFLETLVKVHNSCNAVANSMAHLKGYLVQQCHQRENSAEEIEIVRDEIQENLRALEYSEYMSLIERCECEECVDVKKFDDAYNRCRENGTERQPLVERPNHCILVDSSVRALRAKYKGLSSSSLQKCHYFYLSTPKFSPPTLSTAVPTTVQALTTAYMKRYAKSLDVTEPCPESWYANTLPLDVGYSLVRVAKERVHLFDGDGGEILVGPDDEQVLKDMLTHPNTIRFRLPLCDAPEIRTAFKFKKRHGEQLTSVGTVEVGMEALRTARKILFEAREVQLLVRTREGDTAATPTVEIDSPRFRRVLCDMMITTDVDGDEQTSAYLSGLLANEGYLFPCFKFGIESRVKEGMDFARLHAKGMFRLPDETRRPGFLPWDVKEGHTTSEPVPIRNVNVDEPEALWFGQTSTGSSRDGSDRYYVELTDSDQWLEASCFVQKSTIPGAGLGLFIKPHPPIPKGQFVCLYATHSTTEEAMEVAGSSRDYAIMAEKGKVWFDAEKDDGVCLGRFANQMHVYESLLEASRCSRKTHFNEMREADWKQINDADAQRATLVYEQRKGQMVLVAAKDMPRAEQDHELFSHYGDMREYWLPLIQRNQDRFPENMTSIISWFQHSDECNWTKEQKEKWLGLQI